MNQYIPFQFYNINHFFKCTAVSPLQILFLLPYQEGIQSLINTLQSPVYQTLFIWFPVVYNNINSTVCGLHTYRVSYVDLIFISPLSTSMFLPFFFLTGMERRLSQVTTTTTHTRPSLPGRSQ